MQSFIDLKLQDDISGAKSWTFSQNFRIGRGDNCQLLLEDSSVSRRHADISRQGEVWQVRDLNSRNGTRLNGERLKNSPLPLCSGDVVTVGSVSFEIEIRKNPKPARNNAAAEPAELIETVAHASLEKVLHGLVCKDGDLHGDDARMFALLRAGFHLGNHHSEEELVDKILGDALRALDAQRGAFVLANEKDSELEVRCVKTSVGRRISRFSFSRNLAQRCLREGKSILCPHSAADSILKCAASVLAGEMNSILCVLLRTPRRRLGVLHLDRNSEKPPFTQEDLQLADALAASVSAGLESAQLFREQQELFLGALTTLAQAVELRDPYTAGHAQRVTSYSLLLGRALGLTEKEMNWLSIGTPLHDIGKIGVPDSVLLKPDQLTADEFEIMKSHTVRGEEMLKSLGGLFPILPIVRSHHERWDGGGYPDGLAFEAVPILARVVAVSDSFDAMTTDRPYRDGLTFEDAANEIRQGSGTQFDPDCAEAFFEIRDRLEEEARRCQSLSDAEKRSRFSGTDLLPFISNMPLVSAAN